MCEQCTENISTGKRHVFEYITCPWLMSEGFNSSYDNLNWKETPVSVEGVRVFTLQPFRPIDQKSGMSDKQLEHMKDAFAPIEMAYLSEKMDFDDLFGIRHPMDPKNPYFRQVLLCNGYILISNSFSMPWSGVIKICGEPKELAKIMHEMLQKQLIQDNDWKKDAKAFAFGSEHFFNDEEKSGILLSRDGLVKINGGYAFVVAPKKNDQKFGEEQFCFLTDINMLAKLVQKELERRIDG